MKNKFFISTTLPYCNSDAHVGHLFEFILGDIYARWFRKKYDVRFNVGLDENGSKIKKKTLELGVDLKEYLDLSTSKWKEFCEKFNISYDNFYKTSTDEHYIKVQEIWIKAIENDDIYKKLYTSKYCVGCESFKLDKDLVNGKCHEHQNLTIEDVSEENYFFKLSKYKESLLEWLKSNPIEPTYKQNELLKYINEYDEISISRKVSDTTLGVPVPSDNEHIIYVWLDALNNYSIAAEEYWEGKTLQLCGSDNLRFQAQILQCFLASQNKKHTDKIIVHGTILDANGDKMSKTVGNVVDPIQQLGKFGLDAIRYYCATNFENFSWSEDILRNTYNSHIVGGYGNLVSRVLHLIDISNIDIVVADNIFTTDVNKLYNEAVYSYNNYDLQKSMVIANKIVSLSNQYVNDNKPWSDECINKTEVLSSLYESIMFLNELYRPIFPDKYPIVLDAIFNKKKVIIFNKIS